MTLNSAILGFSFVSGYFQEDSLVTSFDMSSLDYAVAKYTWTVKMAVLFLFCRTFSNWTFCFKKVKKRAFHTFGMKDVLLKRLKDMNISKPTAIQEKVSRTEPSHV